MSALKLPTNSGHPLQRQCSPNPETRGAQDGNELQEGQLRQPHSAAEHVTSELSKLRHSHNEARPNLETRFTLPNLETRFTLPNLKPVECQSHGFSPKSTNHDTDRSQAPESLIDQLRKRSFETAFEPTRPSGTAEKVAQPDNRPRFKALGVEKSKIPVFAERSKNQFVWYKYMFAVIEKTEQTRRMPIKQRNAEWFDFVKYWGPRLGYREFKPIEITIPANLPDEV
jgi:hypothetical protein